MKHEFLIFLTTSLVVVVTGAAVKEIENSNDANAALREQQELELAEENNFDDSIFEKKYFDILPNDLYSDEDVDDVSSKTSKNDRASFSHLPDSSAEPIEASERRVNSRRFRRDLTDDAASSRQKRQNFYYKPHPLTHSRSTYPQYTVDFYFPQEPAYIHQPFQTIFRRDPVYYYQQPQQQQPVRPSYDRQAYYYPVPTKNPNPFHSTNTIHLRPPGNFYLPPNSVNIPKPPHNVVDSTIDEFPVRVGGFEGPEERPIWGASFRPNYNSQNGGGSYSGPSYNGFSGGSNSVAQQPYNPYDRQTTYRPPYRTTQATTQAPPENNNNIDGGQDSDEYEIDGPPGVFEDLNVKLTTRAPLTTRKPEPTNYESTRNPNRNANRRPQANRN